MTRTWAIYINSFLTMLLFSPSVFGIFALLSSDKKISLSYWIVLVFFSVCIIPLAKQCYVVVPPKRDRDEN
jgi:hypothetical protein